MIKKILLLFVLLCSVAHAGDAPVLFFSDLIDGPYDGWNGSSTKGAAVTIWGLNIGSADGTNKYITCAGQTIYSNGSGIAEWGNTSNNARGLESVTFWLNSDMSTGAQAITLTTTDGTSSSLDFYVRTTGDILFVDHANGNNSNDGSYDTDQGGGVGPWQTLPAARAGMSNSDIVYVRSGSSYIEADTFGMFWMSGTATSGSANAMSALVGYPAEFPIIDARTNDISRMIRDNDQYTGDNHHWVISRLKLMTDNAGGMALETTDSDGGFFRFVGCEIDGSSAYTSHIYAGIVNPQNSSDIKILGLKIHDFGYDQYDHAVYFGCNVNDGDNTDRIEVAWCEIYNGGTWTSGIYSHPADSESCTADDISIHDNYIHDLTHAGIYMSSRTIGVDIYNNIVANCNSSGYGAVFLTSDQGSSDIKFIHNTVYSWTSGTGNTLIDWDNTIHYSANATLLNNIIYSLNSTPYNADGSYNGSRTSDYDVWYGNGAAPAWAGSNCVNSDPNFTNASGGDFTLQTGSPADDAGSESSTATTLVVCDYYGKTRSNTNRDIGAVMYNSGASPDPKRGISGVGVSLR